MVYARLAPRLAPVTTLLIGWATFFAGIALLGWLWPPVGVSLVLVALVFELGRRYLGDAEHPTLSLLLAGEKRPREWQSGKAQSFDAFDAKGEVLALLEAAGAPTANLQVSPDAGSTWHPGRSAKVGLGPKTIVATFGELHPRLQKALNAPADAVAAEIYLDAIPAPRSAGHARPAYAPPALQPVMRDFAFIVPADVPAEALLRAIRGSDKAAIAAVRLFGIPRSRSQASGSR